MQFGHTVLKRNFDKNQYFIFIFKIYNKKQLAKANCSEKITSMNLRSITISWLNIV